MKQKQLNIIKKSINGEISYDFSGKFFTFISFSNNNVAPYYWMNREEKTKIVQLTEPVLTKMFKNAYAILLI